MMCSRTSHRLARALLVCLLAVSVLGGHAAGQRPAAIVLQCHAGIGDIGPRGYSGSWLPLRVEILNAGPAVAGTLSVSVTSPRGSASRFERRVELPGGSRQSHDLVIQPGSEPPVARLTVDGEILAETVVAVPGSIGYADLRVAVIDREPTALNDISNVQVATSPLRTPFAASPSPAAPRSGGQSPSAAVPPPPPAYQGATPTIAIRPSVVPADQLPREAHAFGILDAVVLNDAPVSVLDAEQVDALRQWVASGGLLVVAGGADFQGLRVNGLDELLPVDVVERHAGSIPPVLGAVYTELSPDAQTVLAVASPRRGATVLFGSPDTPLVVERRFGAGAVRFLATDPKLAPFRGWTGSGALWGDVLGPAVAHASKHQSHPGPPMFANMYSGEIPDLMYEMGGVSSPRVLYYFLFLLLYLVALGPVNYLVLRSMRRLELAWLTIPALVVVFTLGTIVVAKVSRGFDSVAVTASVDQYFEREGVSLSRGYLLFVPEGKASYEIQLPEHSLIEDSAFANANAPSELVLDQTDRAPTLTAAMNTWDARLLELQRTGGLAAPLRLRVDRSGVTVSNPTPDRFRAVVVLTANGAYMLGDLPAGGEARGDAPQFFGQAFPGWYRDQLGSFPEGQRFFGALTSSTAAFDDFAGGPLPDGALSTWTLDRTTFAWFERPLVVGMRDADRPAVDVQTGARGRNLALVLQHASEVAR